MYVLEVMSGPLDGTRWRFEHEITIGRDESAVGACIAIDRYLSRSHARLQSENNRLTLVDLSSRNGTTVDGRPVEMAELYPGKAFTCGRTVLRVVSETAAGAAQPAVSAPISHVASIEEMRSRLLTKPVGFIPTMGALHDGHLRLIEQAQLECASVIVSIFVNPLQFAPSEDLQTYPRDLQRDLELLAERNVGMVFVPDAAQMYTPQFGTRIDIGEIGTRYEGLMRPDHFTGVATILAKLLHIVTPSRLYLGQKDAQQIAVTRQFMRDLNFTPELVIVPTVRESDGLAFSSRNRYLSKSEREFAPMLYRGLFATAGAYGAGLERDEAVLLGRGMIDDAARLENIDVSLDYFELVDADSFLPLGAERSESSRPLAIGALRFPTVRLLDNVPVDNA